MKEDFLNHLKKTKKIKVDLLNGIIVELKFDKNIKAFRGYSNELDMPIGIWELKTLYQIATEKNWNCKLIMEE